MVDAILRSLAHFHNPAYLLECGTRSIFSLHGITLDPGALASFTNVPPQRSVAGEILDRVFADLMRYRVALLQRPPPVCISARFFALAMAAITREHYRHFDSVAAHIDAAFVAGYCLKDLPSCLAPLTTDAPPVLALEAVPADIVPTQDQSMYRGPFRNGFVVPLAPNASDEETIAWLATNGVIDIDRKHVDFADAARRLMRTPNWRFDHPRVSRAQCPLFLSSQGLEKSRAAIAALHAFLETLRLHVCAHAGLDIPRRKTREAIVELFFLSEQGEAKYLDPRPPKRSRSPDPLYVPLKKARPNPDTLSVSD